MKNIDLVSINGTYPNEAVLALRHCRKYFEFGRTILFTHVDLELDDIEVINISKLNSIDEYNEFVLSLGNYLDNEYVLVVQDDGFILNPDLWTDEFLKYDYIGAPWPGDMEWVRRSCGKVDYRGIIHRKLTTNRVGNGGFSLRSRKFLDYSAQFKSCEGWGEDAFLCMLNCENAIKYGIKFPPVELALRFSCENPMHDDNFTRDYTQSGLYLNPQNHFGWHGKNFLNSNELISLKYL